MITIALYARVSSSQQAQRATIDSQIAAIKERAAADGHRVAPDDLYVDDGFSGSTLARPALERLRDRVAEGAIDLIYVHGPDRLARRYAYQVLLLEEFAARGVRVVFLYGATGQTAEETLLTQVQGMIAEYERARMMERYRRGKLHRARQGLVNPLAGAPYGYRYVPCTATEPARYEVMLAEAKVVRDLFDGLVHRQHSLAQLARSLNAAGVPTRRGAPWDRGTISYMLGNPAYMGQAAYGKSESTPRNASLRPRRHAAATPRHAKSSARRRSPEQWISIPVPALVSAEVFAAAREQLERNRKLSARNARGSRYLLQGLVVCACCGYAYYGRTVSPSRSRTKAPYAYYQCGGHHHAQRGEGRACDNRSMRVDALDAYVWDAARATLQDPARVLNEWARRAENDRVQTERRAQRDAAAQVVTQHERSLTRLLDAYEAGALDLPELTGRSERLKTRLKRAQQDLKVADAQLAEVVTLRSVTGRLEDFAARVHTGLDQLSWVERRSLLRLLVARIEIDAEGATIVFRVPPSPGPRATLPKTTSFQPWRERGGEGGNHCSIRPPSACRASPGARSCRAEAA
jgi:site-specific DNA recombinase